MLACFSCGTGTKLSQDNWSFCSCGLLAVSPNARFTGLRGSKLGGFRSDVRYDAWEGVVQKFYGSSWRDVALSEDEARDSMNEALARSLIEV